MQVVVGTTTYQRVTFPAGGPGATLHETELALLPMLADLTTPLYYAQFGDMVTVTFNFATPPATNPTIGNPVADLHVSDVTLGTTDDWQYISVSKDDTAMTRSITYRSTHATDATSVTTTVDIGTAFAQPTEPATDGQATIHYDNTAPTLTDNAITIAAPPGSPSPPDSVWGGDFPLFNLTFSVSDDSTGSGLPDTNPVRIETDTDKLEVVVIGLGTQVDPATDTEYLVQIRPKVGRETTAGEVVVITVVPVDKAGNEGSASTSVKLAASTPADALYQSAAPASGNVMPGGTVTLTFDKDPGVVTASVGAITAGATPSTRTLTIPDPQAAGALPITLRWGQSGRQVLNYTVVIPPAAAVAFTSAAPSSGSVVAGSAITLTFAGDPGTVTSSLAGAVITGIGATRTLTIPANHQGGQGSITIVWRKAGHQDGLQTLTYTITRPFASANPTDPENISAPIEIPANSYVVVVRSKADAANISDALKFPMVDDKEVEIREWADMPDLEALFNRSSFGQGGALVLRKSVDARDNDNAAGTGTYATPALGSVGISEIMWALDLGQVNRNTWKVGQWIELHNLNSKPVKVLLYAETARELVSNQLVDMTAAGDSIAGGLGGNVLDVVQNINNNGDQAQGGWDLPGKSGNSRTGENLIGAHRILPDKQAAYSAAQNYTKRDGRNKDHWRAATNVYLSSETRRSLNHVTTVVVADYLGTPGSRNDFTGVSLLTRDGRTGVPANRIVFNEVANRANANKAYEWIELRNVSGGTVNLKNYKISAVTAVDTDTEIINFGGDLNIPAGGILLLLASDPVYNRDHPIQIGTGVQYKVIEFKGNGLPDGGNFVLILRGRADNKGVGTGNADNTSWILRVIILTCINAHILMPFLQLTCGH